MALISNQEHRRAVHPNGKEPQGEVLFEVFDLPGLFTTVIRWVNGKRNRMEGLTFSYLWDKGESPEFLQEFARSREHLQSRT